MRASRFSEEQIIGILKEAEAGVKAADLVRKHGISMHTFYLRIPAERERPFRPKVSTDSGDGEHRFRRS